MKTEDLKTGDIICVAETIYRVVHVEGELAILEHVRDGHRRIADHITLSLARRVSAEFLRALRLGEVQ